MNLSLMGCIGNVITRSLGYSSIGGRLDRGSTAASSLFQTPNQLLTLTTSANKKFSRQA